MSRLDPILVAMALLLPAGAGAMETLPTARDDSVLGAFQAQCLREEPNYERLVQQAKALGMADLGDHVGPGLDGGTIDSHRFGGKLDDGPFALYASRVTSKAWLETSCGVSGSVKDAAHFRVGLVRTMALPPDVAPEDQSDGSAISIWRNVPLPGQRLILQTRTGKDGKGYVLMTITVRRAP